MDKINIYIDGGSRGNPGPSAGAAVFTDSSGRIVREFSQYLGGGTNNEAEYKSLILALRKAKAFFGKEKIKNIDFKIFSDSELLVSQLNGAFKIKEPRIQQLFIEAWNLRVDFPRFVFCLIPREKNKQADQLVNQTIDGELKKQKLF